MNKIIKTIIIAISLALVYVLVHSIAWADILFWKTGKIALICEPIEVLIFPLQIIPIAPGSLLDTPWFIIPMAIIVFIFWAIIIQVVIGIIKRKKDA